MSGTITAPFLYRLSWFEDDTDPASNTDVEVEKKIGAKVKASWGHVEVAHPRLCMSRREGAQALRCAEVGGSPQPQPGAVSSKKPLETRKPLQRGG